MSADTGDLLKKLRSGSARARREGIRMARDAGPAAKEAIIPLVAIALREPNDAVRGEAADALIHLDAGAEIAQSLGQALEDEEGLVRQRAAALCGRLGARASATAGALLLLAFHDQDESVRAAALAALGSLGAAARATVPELSRMLGEGEEDVRRAAAYVLMQLGPDADGAVAALAASLADEAVRLHAIMALGAIGPAASAAIPALSRLTSDAALAGPVALALSRIAGSST